ncbi:multicopper oxidase type 3 (plasmid) [Haloterrigena turkmenica DSM 5511]|uniref:Multicopper oxidase type 3 n=1 Tax=Haloterrigena turkmenica (strain ATCC 51198 / DSM 5511 / JCM 9101 / NCIMB 13204 / VKM B-1734 / 4k) TaxID=543526 RepID=D2S150_HALTV|nr:multicopper oxidase family protein [Haloterrigena turkmenica]ADB63097.1 multicopper oxidase type 3 [Haloterrigena turkmenica DSM 5511]
MDDNDRTVPRRQALRIGGVTLFGTAGLTSGIGSAALERTAQENEDDEAGDNGGGLEETLVASSGEVDVGADESTETWVYEEQLPGPELRVSEGETLRVSLENQLPEGTTIHWHGVPVPNPMDGVPDVTQDPVSSDGTFEYEYEASPAGTYVYHSHVGLQLDRGLYGPLIVEEESPHVEYDREYTLQFDDYLAEEPALDSIGAPPGGGDGMGPGGGPEGDGDGMGPGGDGMGPGGEGGGGGPGNGRGPGGDGMGPGGGPGGDGNGMGPDGGPGGDGDGMGPGSQMMSQRPPYEGLLVNGRLPSEPPVFEVEEGERVRLRFINPSSTTTYRVGVGGHSLTVTHADGRPVEPVEVDSFVMSMGERYDAILEADSPGEWAVVAEPVVGDEDPAEARLRYETADDGSAERPGFDGRELEYGDLATLEPLELDGEPDRTFDLTLSGGMMGGADADAWTIDGEVYPDADPFEISEGDHVRVRMVNRSPAIHPMHLHGHFFQVGDAVKDTVLVAPHGDQVTFDFRADNPGDWLFHCHNVYHLERGMARVFEYD